jgi:hypothetical protein
MNHIIFRVTLKAQIASRKKIPPIWRDFSTFDEIQQDQKKVMLAFENPAVSIAV